MNDWREYHARVYPGCDCTPPPEQAEQEDFDHDPEHHDIGGEG